MTAHIDPIQLIDYIEGQALLDQLELRALILEQRLDDLDCEVDPSYEGGDVAEILLDRFIEDLKIVYLRNIVGIDHNYYAFVRERMEEIDAVEDESDLIILDESPFFSKPQMDFEEYTDDCLNIEVDEDHPYFYELLSDMMSEVEWKVRVVTDAEWDCYNGCALFEVDQF